MTTSVSIALLIFVAFVAANVPWANERFLLFIKPKSGEKGVWLRLLEWLTLYFMIGLLAIGLERKVTGQIHSQDWEFYAITFCLFLVFALPGFIYRHDLRHTLKRT